MCVVAIVEILLNSVMQTGSLMITYTSFFFRMRHFLGLTAADCPAKKCIINFLSFNLSVTPLFVQFTYSYD